MKKNTAKLLAEIALAQMGLIEEQAFDARLARLRAAQSTDKAYEFAQFIQTMQAQLAVYKAAELLIVRPLVGHEEQLSRVRAMCNVRIFDTAGQIIAYRNS